MNHFEKIQNALKENKLDAILLTGEANRFYASGYRTPGDDGMALVTRDKSYYMIDSRYIESAREKVEGAEVLLTDRNNKYHDYVKEIVKNHKVKRMGFEDRSMSVAVFTFYKKQLSCKWIEASAVLDKLRGQKDEDELSKMRKAQAIAEKALLKLYGDIKEGVTELELAAKLQYYMLSFGAEKLSFDSIIASGENSAIPHAVPTERKLKKGDFVTIDCGCMYGGYCSDMTRTVAVGCATDKMKEIYNIVLKAQKNAISAARAGLTGQELDFVARSVIEDAGYGEYFGHSFGHSLGIEIHEAPYVSPANKMPLPENAVVSAEPGIYIPGKFGVRIEDALVLQKDGAENLTKIDKELLVL